MAEAVMCVAAEEAAAAAARAIYALRFADLGGRPPAWLRPLPDPDPPPEAPEAAAAEPQRREVPRWPRTVRGKRSRRPSAGGIRGATRDATASASASAEAARVKRMRASPASPLDYSGGSAASTSGGGGGGGGGGDEGSTSSAEGRVGPTTATNKAGMNGRQAAIRRFQTPQAKNPRPGKKKALPELQKEVRSLVEENEMLRKEAEDLHRACEAASAENRTLQLRLNQRNVPPKANLPATEERQKAEASPCDAAPPPPLVQCDDDGEGDGFRIPDLNLPASDDL